VAVLAGLQFVFEALLVNIVFALLLGNLGFAQTELLYLQVEGL
jgi:hypothetical protein